MIRFINIGDQIAENCRAFAFFDTVTNTFLAFDGEQVFETEEEFIDAASGELLDHCLSLIPESVFKSGRGRG